MVIASIFAAAHVVVASEAAAGATAAEAAGAAFPAASGYGQEKMSVSYTHLTLPTSDLV